MPNKKITIRMRSVLEMNGRFYTDPKQAAMTYARESTRAWANNKINQHIWWHDPAFKAREKKLFKRVKPIFIKLLKSTF